MAERSFWEQAGDVLLGGIGKAVDAEFTEPQKVNAPDVYRSVDSGTTKQGKPVVTGISAVPLWGWAAAALGLAGVIFVVARR